MGLSTLAVAVGEEPDTIEDVYEPYLLQQGLLMRTPRGRVATPAAFSHLGLEAPREGLLTRANAEGGAPFAPPSSGFSIRLGTRS